MPYMIIHKPIDLFTIFYRMSQLIHGNMIHYIEKKITILNVVPKNIIIYNKT